VLLALDGRGEELRGAVLPRTFSCAASSKDESFFFEAAGSCERTAPVAASTRSVASQSGQWTRRTSDMRPLSSHPMTVVTEEKGGWKKRLKALGLARRRLRRAVATGPTAPHVLRGRDGEETAAAFLASKGARVLARNVRYRDGELDLVAQCGGALVFVEVKRRASSSRGDAAECVTPLKRARILRAARRWLAENPSREERAIRFDVVAIEDAPPRVDWIQGAFDASA